MTPLQKNIFFNVFTWVLIFIDPTFWSCTSIYGRFLNILHQYICSIILFLGPLYGYYIENVLIMILTLLGWIITGHCVITTETNKACKDKKGLPFRNFPFHLKEYTIPFIGEKKDHKWWATRIDYTLLIILIIYNIYMSKIIKL